MSVQPTIQAHIPQGAAIGATTEQSGIQRALILPGGGLRLSYAAGVMDELFKNGLTFSHMDGTSGGSLNLAMLLSGLTSSEICERWRSLKMRSTFSFMPLSNYLWPPCFVAASSSKAFRRKVYPQLGINFEKSALPLVLQPVLICVILPVKPTRSLNIRNLQKII